MNTFKDLNDLIRGFNFSSDALHQFENHIESTLKKFPVSQIKINKDRALYRCRKYNLPIDSLFQFESDLSYRTDLNRISNFGRCNIPNNSIFYGSMVHYSSKNISPTHMTDHGYLTAVFETTSLLDNPSSEKISEGVEVYGVGMWEASEDFYVCVMPPNEVNKEESTLAKELLETHENNMSQVNANLELREFYKLMGNEFSKYMHDKPNNQYAISALFATHMIRSTGGIAYASVRTEQKGFNLALSPTTIDNKFKFRRAGVGELWKFGKEMHFRFIANAERDLGLPLSYNKANIPQVSVETMIKHFENKGICPNHITKVLIESNYLKV